MTRCCAGPIVQASLGDGSAIREQMRLCAMGLLAGSAQHPGEELEALVFLLPNIQMQDVLARHALALHPFHELPDRREMWDNIVRCVWQLKNIRLRWWKIRLRIRIKDSCGAAPPHNPA